MEPVFPTELFSPPAPVDQALILDQVDDAIALLDAHQQLVLFNQKLINMWHLPKEKLQQRPQLETLLDWLQQAGYWQEHQCRQVLDTCQSIGRESRALQIEQRNDQHLEISITRTSNQGQLLIFRNITLQHQYQQQLANEVKRLSFLLGLTERLQTSDNLQEIGQFALKYLVGTMGAAFADVKVINGKGSQRHAATLTNQVAGEFIATYGNPAIQELEKTLSAGIPYGQGLLWDVVDSGEPIFVEDYANHPKAVNAFRHPAIGQLGIFPIPSVDGTIIGVLTLESRSLANIQEAPQQDMLLAACRTLGAAIERVQNQASLHQINQDLERASQLKSEFLASMSHELRTPLNSILGFSELLLRHPDIADNNRHKNHVQTIHRSGQHLLALINDILDLSKIEAGKLDIDLQRVSIQELCRQCLKMVQPRAERKRLSLSLELDYCVDQVIVDERRVRQMVINLLSNAVKFTPEKGAVKLAVRLAYGNQLRAESRPDQSPINSSTPYLCIEVADTGIGIAPEKQTLLFSPFQQIDSSLTRRHEGTGLGLALTKRMAELHGGTVSFVTCENQGSSFRIWLPLNEFRGELDHDESIESRTPENLYVSKNRDNRHERPRVLVVEDQPYNQSLISELLELEGFAVELVGDGGRMAEVIHSDLGDPKVLPHLILMDIQLPYVDGIQLIQQLRAAPTWSSVPVIAVTAMAMARDRESCLAAGADDYVSKPIDFNELLQKVRQLLNLGVSP